MCVYIYIYIYIRVSNSHVISNWFVTNDAPQKNKSGKLTTQATILANTTHANTVYR